MQLPIALQHGLVELGRAAQGFDKQRRRNAVQLGVCGIEDDQPLFGKDARVKLSEGVGEGLAFNVALTQVIRGQGLAQQSWRLARRVRWFLRRNEYALRERLPFLSYWP